MINVKLPDGGNAQFPDGTSAETIQAALQQQFGSSQNPGNAPQSPAYSDALAAGSMASRKLADYDPNAPKPVGQPDLMGATAATLGGIVNSIPIIGPMSQAVSDNLVGVGAQITGGNYEEARNAAITRRQELAAANPIANIAGNVGGAVGSFGVMGATQQGANAIGMAGPTLQRIVNSGLSTTGLTAADNMVRGQAPTEALGNAILPGSISAAIPLAGAGTRAVANAAGERLSPIYNAVRKPVEEAARRVGVAVGRDVKANPTAMMSAADEAIARQSGLPLINVDRGGETTRALARSVANQSPEARGIIDRTVDDRFTSQAPRAVEFIKRLTGGAVDDLGYQRSIQDVARAVNKPRYEAAFTAPNAQAVWNQPIRELMQSNTFRAAISAAESRGTDKAAISGFKAVKNPFEFRPDGSVTLKVNADGSRALPSLAFWDQVKRNLDGMIGTAQRSGDNALMSDLTQMKAKLVDSLDRSVGQYKVARQGAASFFDAEDALDAGKKFATQPRAIPEATQAFSKFNGAEKQAFATGYASELIDRIKASGDRRNIIQQVFGSPAAREMNELVFGKAKAQQLEAFVKVEALADMLRGAMGGSTTARQLQELGLGAGVGGVGAFGLSGGDWRAGMQGMALGAGAAGARILGQRVDNKVMQEVAKLLTTDNPEALQKAVYNASLSPKWMNALDDLSAMLAPISRGMSQQTSGNQISNNNAQPLRVTVNGAGSYNGY